MRQLNLGRSLAVGREVPFLYDLISTAHSGGTRLRSFTEEISMLLALLYTTDGCLEGAALACDQEPYGRRYWTQIFPRAVQVARDSETAYLDIDDAELIARLVSMDFTDGYSAADAVDRYVNGRAKSDSQVTRNSADR
jgi:hypothetical protein